MLCPGGKGEGKGRSHGCANFFNGSSQAQARAQARKPVPFVSVGTSLWHVLVACGRLGWLPGWLLCLFIRDHGLLGTVAKQRR